VVIENSRSKTLDFILKKYAKYFIVRYYLESSYGIPGARNKIINKSKGDILSFVDDDCVLPPDWCERITNDFSEDRKLVAIVGRSLNYFRDSYIADLEQSIHEQWLSQYINPQVVSELKYGIFVNTRNFSVKKSVIKRRRIYFSRKAPFKLEDTDFGLKLFSKLNLKKMRVIYDPNVYVYHKNSRFVVEFLKRRESVSSGEDYLRDKYPEILDIPKITLTPLRDLERKNYLIWLLFFVERQYRRLLKLIRKGEFMWDTEKNLSVRLWQKM
jgi:glycosyltransferase involved in cell wall biosynthesis